MSTFYMQTVPNSHSFGSLLNILTTFEYESEIENRTRDYFLIGFKNTFKNEREIGLVGTLANNGPVFSCIQDIIMFLENNYDEKTFITTIQNTLNNGLDLKSKRKMERRDVYKCLDTERDYQDLRWTPRKETNGIPDEQKPPEEWINYMEFHLAKAKEAVYFLREEEALAEVRKVAALAVRCLELHGCPERVIPEELLNQV